MKARTFTVLHFACGAGAGAYGMRHGKAELGMESATFKTVGGIDIDPLGLEDFRTLNPGVPTLLSDLHDLQPADLLRFCRECPDVVFSSPPCKGYSGLLPKKAAAAAKYQRMNELVERCIELSTTTWDRVPGLLVLENVPRIMQRGTKQLERVRKLLAFYGYVVDESFHDCGEIGGLGAHRYRYLLVARQPKGVTAFVHHAPKQRVKACGEVIGELPLPNDPANGDPLHVLPDISWITWLRLALIPPGGDWRDLPGAKSSKGEGNWTDRPGLMKVADYNQPSPTVTGSVSVTSGNGCGAVAEPMPEGLLGKSYQEGRTHNNNHRVEAWSEPAHTVTGATRPGSGLSSVAQPLPEVTLRPRAHIPRWEDEKSEGLIPNLTGNFEGGLTSEELSKGHYSRRHDLDLMPKYGKGKKELRRGNFKVTDYSKPADTIRGVSRPDNGAASVAQPLPEAAALSTLKQRFSNKYKVRDFEKPAGTVTGDTDIQAGAQSVAVPLDDLPPELRSPLTEDGQKRGSVFRRLHVADLMQPSRTISGPGHNGAFAVADLVPIDCEPHAGVYGVTDWQTACATVTGSARVDNGRFAVADPRPDGAMVPIIVTRWGTWNRPFTRRELACLQGFPVRLSGGKFFVFAGKSTRKQIERIGNAVPVQAATAIATSLLTALLASALGTWFLGSTGIWVEGTPTLPEVEAERREAQ